MIPGYIRNFFSLSAILLISGCVYDLPTITYIRPVPIVTNVVALDCPQTCIQKRETDIASCSSSYNNCLLKGYHTCSKSLNSCRLHIETTYNDCYNSCSSGRKTSYTTHTQTSTTYINQNNVNYINQHSPKYSSSYNQNSSSKRQENERKAYNNYYQRPTNYNSSYNQSARENQKTTNNKENDRNYKQEDNRQQSSVIIPPPPSSEVDKEILNQNPQASESAKLRLAEKLERRRKQEAEKNAGSGVIELPGN
jgi:hypothetical protein